MIILNESEKEVIRKVIEDMQQSCGIFRGSYDARNDDTAFMNGVATTMEVLAYYVDEDYAEEQDIKFIENMILSEEKARDKRKNWWKPWTN